MIVSGRIGHRDQEVIEFKKLRKVRRESSRLKDFKKANFNLFREVAGQMCGRVL